MQKIGLVDLLPFIEEAFSRGADFKIPITGTSMNPLLYQGRDFVKIVKPQLPLAVGDIPLYRRADGTFVLHRVVKIKADGEYVLCGDNQFLLETGITDANIIGVVKTVIRDGREFSVDTDEWYLKHKEKYIKNINTRYPVRRLRYALSTRLKRLSVQSNESSTSLISADYGTLPNQSQSVNSEILAVGKILVGAIAAEIAEKSFEFPENTDFKKLYDLAQKHRVIPLAAGAVLNSAVADEEIKKIYKKELFRNSARYYAQESEAQQLSAEFSKNGIHHCFLKGTKVSAYYKNPDTRFMLDMDIYVEKEKQAQAGEILLSRGYTANNGDDKDTGYIKAPFLNVELHKELKYDYDKGYSYYKGAFERLVCVNGCEMKMTDEDFYVYILSHTAHHFAVAGTGIKSVADHYYLKAKLKPRCDADKLRDALEQTGLSQFSDRMDKLCEYWFGDGDDASDIKEMADYIILSGVFGNRTNQYLSGMIRGEYGESKKSYFISRLLPPLDTMKIRYPVLKKAPVLLPAFWGIRLIGSLFSAKRVAGETKTVNTVEKGAKDTQEAFLKNMGL